MSNDPRIQLALDNWDNYVAKLATLSDKELSKKLDIINLQAEIAHEKKLNSSSELIEIWWRQVVEARIYKAEYNIPDAPNEIELAIADIETVVSRSAQRQEAVEEYMNPVTPKAFGARLKFQEKQDDERQL